MMDSPQGKRHFHITRMQLILVIPVLLTGACSTSTTSVTSIQTSVSTQEPTSTPVPTASPAPTIGPTSTTASSCSTPTFTSPPGQLPPHVPLPPNSLVSPPNYTSGPSDGSYEIEVCTPSGTAAYIANYMNNALPANGWQRSTSNKGCYKQPPYQWVQGNYGIYIGIADNSMWSGGWGIGVCTPI